MKLKGLIGALLATWLVLFAGLSGGLHAQTNPPLVILSAYDLWMFDGTTLTNLTQNGHLMDAALSPDGTRVAYIAWSPISIEAVERSGGIGGGPLPADVSIIDLTTRAITRVAPQPIDASFLMNGVEDNALLRSVPTWSPDGSRLAWGEVHYPSFSAESNRLMVYDVNQGTTTVLAANLPEQAGIPQPVTPMWGNSGIAFVSAGFNPENTTFPMSLAIYSAQDGHQISYTLIPDTETRMVFEHFWVNTGSMDEIAVQYAPAGNWDLIAPLSGTVHPALALPELHNPHMSDSAAVTFTYHPDASWPDFYSWEMAYPNGQHIASQKPVSDIARVTLAPDGQTLAQVTTDGVLSILFPDGQVLEGPILEDPYVTLFWGPTAWRVDQPAACGSALPPRLVLGQIGILSPNTTPNNVRSAPATGEVVGQLQPGEDFSVLAGPECVNEMYWWQIDNGNGLVGWTAEGDSSTYWLEPVIG